uniref:Uncharacterized protein n=1 Tax=Scleropages formosus TaxID=113540 RepID=A0A8C9R5E8_SCLFO
MQKSTMGIYVITKQGPETGHYDDIGIYLEGADILEDTGSVPRACAMMLRVIYALNMADPKHLKYYYEFIQKVLFWLDSERLSPKILGLKSKISTGLFRRSCKHEPI